VTVFRYKDESDPSKYAEELCQNMHIYTPQHYIAGDSLYFNYDPNVLVDILEKLTPRRLNIALHCKGKPEEFYDSEEKWFKTKYKRERE